MNPIIQVFVSSVVFALVAASVSTFVRSLSGGEISASYFFGRLILFGIAAFAFQAVTKAFAKKPDPGDDGPE
ncbi:hypothetical protein GC197_03075 [bacterium]|nr:hypothetical protein [bacterium]